MGAKGPAGNDLVAVGVAGFALAGCGADAASSGPAAVAAVAAATAGVEPGGCNCRCRHVVWAACAR
eukprot:3193881-Alexandrium_andersonii.AAC.1